MRHLRFIRLIACGAALLSAIPVHAADSACSPDGKILYRLNWANERDVVEVINTDTQKVTILDLPPNIPAQNIAGLAISNAGHLLLALPNAVWAFDVKKNKGARVCGAPEGAAIQGITYDSNTSAILLTAWAEAGGLRSDLWILPKDGKKPLPVVNRRAGGIDGLTFLPDGRTVFAARGDLWIGTVSLEDEESGTWSLGAIRFAPIGEWETANATSNSYGAREVAPAQDGVWVHVGRLGGSGSGKILKVPVPPAGTEEATYKLMADALAAVQETGETGTRAWLCGDAKGNLAYYFLDGGKLIRAEAGKEPVELGTFGTD